MGLLNRAKKAYSVLITKELGNSIGAVTRNYWGGSEFNPQRQVKGITYKAIDKIGQSMSVYEPLIAKKNGEAYSQHPLLNFFAQPNPRLTRSDFIYLWAMLYEIYGETFWYFARGEMTNKVKEVYLLNPAQVELKMYNGELIGYVLHKANGDKVPLELEEVIHDMRPNPFNEWRGMSVLERASVYVDTEITTATFTLNYMRNNASPSGIVSLPTMTPEAFKQFTQQWREGYEGPENAGKTAFIRGGEADFKAVGATLKDVDQKVTREMAMNDVLMMLEVPKPLLGMTDGEGFGRGNLEALHYIFTKEKLEPMMTRLDNILGKIAKMGGLGGLRTDGTAIEITHTSPIPEDKEYNLQHNVKAVNRWKTVNEVRAAEGLDPIAGGDILMPENAAPLNSGNKIATPKKKIILKKASAEDEVKKINDEREAFRSKLVDTNEVYAKKLKSEIGKFANEQEAKVIDKINVSTKAYEEWLPEVKEESIALAAIITPIIIKLMEKQGEDVANFITGELLTITPEIRAAVEAEVLKISGLYNEETLKALQKTLTEGSTNGESLVKLKKRVEQVYSDAKGYRAERIARTESLKASNGTAELVYKENGFSTVEWFTNPGACQFCASMNGRTKTIGATFVKVGDVLTDEEGNQMKIDFADIGTPPLHPNCRCSLVPGE